MPALISLGTGLGIALHTLLYNWDSHIQLDMLPSLYWSGDEVTITYDDDDNRDMDGDAAGIIPIAINKEGPTGSITLERSDGKKETTLRT